MVYIDESPASTSDVVVVQNLLKIIEICMGCARFAEILQNFRELQIFWSLCSVVFRTLTLKLPIQTSLSVASKLPVSLSSAENCHKFKKENENEHTQ